MAEKRIAVETTTISYSGILDVNNLYNYIDNYTNERGWDKMDFMHDIKNHETTRDILIDMRPEKTISDYVKFKLKIVAKFSNITDIEVTVDGKKVNVQKGSVKISYTGIIITDYEGDWKSTAWWQFMKTLYDKYVFKLHESEYDANLKSEIFNMKHEISAYLNLKKYIDSRPRI